MKKTSREPKELLSQPKIFCTECGVELENFCFSRGVTDIEAIKKTLAQCRKEGKSTGDFCSKLFVADPNSSDALLEEE